MVTIVKHALVVITLSILSLILGMALGALYINTYMIEEASSCGLSTEQACDSLSVVMGE